MDADVLLSIGFPISSSVHAGVYKELFLSVLLQRDARSEHLCTDFSTLNSLFGALPMTFG